MPHPAHRAPSRRGPFLALLALTTVTHLWPGPLPLLLPHASIAQLTAMALWSWFGVLMSPWPLFELMRVVSFLGTVALLVRWRWRR